MTTTTPKAGAMDKAIEVMARAAFRVADDEAVSRPSLQSMERALTAALTAGFIVARPVADADLREQLAVEFARWHVQGSDAEAEYDWASTDRVWRASFEAKSDAILKLLAARDAARDAEIATLRASLAEAEARCAKARAEAFEEAAQIAEGSAGPFPRGEKMVADGSAARALAIAMQHDLGGGRDAIATAIRARAAMQGAG